MAAIDHTTLSFTTTAMPRPEIVRRTFQSFTRHLWGLDFSKVTLYLNIDRLPGGIDDDKRAEVLDIARRFFGTVVVNMPETPNFAAAVKWCFSQVTGPFNFHLEDDWELLAPVKLSTIEKMFLPPHVQQVALRSRPNVRQDFWLCPAVTRGDFCRRMAAGMRINENPEVEIRALLKQDKAYSRSGFLYVPFDHQALIVQDIGRPWIAESRFLRGATHFTRWSIRKDGG